jgi:general secretion pathway protein E/type IV pilus assembly protein PilB
MEKAMKDRIEPEILQYFTHSQAWEYMLVPFEAEGDALACYGATGRDYGPVLQQLKVLYYIAVMVVTIEASELEKLLRKHYSGESSHPSQVRSITG